MTDRPPGAAAAGAARSSDAERALGGDVNSVLLSAIPSVVAIVAMIVWSRPAARVSAVVATSVVTTALIVGDLQVGITRDFPFAAVVIDPVAAVLPAARSAGVLVVFVRTALRRNRTDLADTNPLMTSFFDSGETFREGAPETEVDPRLGSHPGDVTVVKRRTSAFAGTDLDLVLRARGVDGIVLTVVATSAMVAATAYDAADRDYRVTVLADAVADADPVLHDAVLAHVLPARGFTVSTTTAWLAELGMPFRPLPAVGEGRTRNPGTVSALTRAPARTRRFARAPSGL